MENNKSPGSDGINVELYMVCIEFLSDYKNSNPNIKCQTNENVNKI